MASIVQAKRGPVKLQDLLETPNQVRRLTADILTIVAIFAGRPEPGTRLMQACLPGLLRYVADSGGNLRDTANILKQPAHLVTALRAAAWQLDDDVLDALDQPESSRLLRRWSAIVAELSESLTVTEELERRTAQVPCDSWYEDEESA